MQLNAGFYDDYGNFVESTGDGANDYTITPMPNTTDMTGAYVDDTPTAPSTGGNPTSQQTVAVKAADPSNPADLSWLDKLANAVPKALQLYNAQQIAAVNVERAKRGQSAINPAMYSPQVGVGMDAGTQNLVLFGALGLGALLLLGGKGGKGRK